jgi:hypothetical protein
MSIFSYNLPCSVRNAILFSIDLSSCRKELCRDLVALRSTEWRSNFVYRSHRVADRDHEEEPGRLFGPGRGGR